MTPDQIDRITRAYAFTPDDKASLTSLLSAAYMHAKQAAYQRAHTAARVSLPVWRPGDADATAAHDWANERVNGIADTYESLLRSQLEQMGDDETQEALGDLWQGVKGIVKRVADWITGFLPWKTEQIAQDTWNEGDNDGTEQFIGDVKSSGTDYSKLRVRVLPEESSSDFCKDFAGKDFSFDDPGTDACPSFPAHTNCIHYLYVYTVNEQGDEVEVNI